MPVSNLSVERIIIHQIFQKTSDKFTTPVKSTEYTNFDPEAMADFQNRVITALGQDSKAVEMKIIDQGNDALPQIVNTYISSNDNDFIEHSYEIACKLAKAQFDKSRSISGGIVVVFTGKQGYPQTKFLGVIKADIHSGYEKHIDPANGQISLKHIKDLLLTPNSKLFKTIGYCEKVAVDAASNDLNDKWSVLIFDSQISQADGKVSAAYFYRKFAGCGYIETCARTTKQFYETTKDFILKLKKTPEEKYDLLNALTTYLKVDKSSTIEPTTFAETYFDTDTRDDYKNYLKDHDVQTSAFTKDIEHIKSYLKIHKVTFSNNVKLEADPEVFKRDVLVETIKGDADENGNIPDWTQINIKSQLTVKK